MRRGALAGVVALALVACAPAFAQAPEKTIEKPGTYSDLFTNEFVR